MDGKGLESIYTLVSDTSGDPGRRKWTQRVLTSGVTNRRRVTQTGGGSTTRKHTEEQYPTVVIATLLQSRT